MIEMKLSASLADPAVNILELKITAPAAVEPTPIPVDQVPTLIYIDDSVEEETLPQITHALTDTVNRTTWPDQIQLLTTSHKLPEHLALEPISKDHIFDQAQELGQCKLIFLTNENNKEFKRKIARSSEFLTETYVIEPTTTIELIDNLNDHIKDLKQKTIVNLKIEIELPEEHNTLEPINYIPNLTKVGNTHFANLIDLASEEEKAYAFRIGSPECKATFELEDLVLARVVVGGQRVSIKKTI
jgi:hypothetical protein